MTGRRPRPRTVAVTTGVVVAVAVATTTALVATGVVPGDDTVAGDVWAGRSHDLAQTSPAEPGAATDPQATAQPEPPEDPVAHFLATYVDDEGRVVRVDEGGDTVSEGQAYGLLLATAAGDADLVRTIWGWTEENLVGVDGLMAWRWDAGEVVDPNAATDADLDAAWALVVAGERFDDPQLTADGLSLADAVVVRATRPVDTGRALLAGPWVEGPPYLVNPSYSSPGALSVLGRATDDPVWAELAATDAQMLDDLGSMADLPPDWAQLDEAGGVEIMAPPGGGEVTFGLDAARVPVRLAASCDTGDRARAGALADVLRGASPSPGRRDLGGTATVEWTHALADVASAAALAADDDTVAARERLRQAALTDAATPTYYGAAWVALADVLLVQPDVGLRGCAPLLPEEET